MATTEKKPPREFATYAARMLESARAIFNDAQHASEERQRASVSIEYWISVLARLSEGKR